MKEYTTEERQALIDSLGLTYDAQFVPQSLSRNAGEKHKSINWRITIKKGANVLTTDYMQGIGHIPNFEKLGRGYDRQEAEGQAAEKGLYKKNPNSSWLWVKLPTPPLMDVLHSLVLDSEALYAGCFEDWAGEYGYETDSRAAERIYQLCVDIGRQLRKLVEPSKLAELRNAYSNY
jgi:hypothetical protein